MRNQCVFGDFAGNMAKLACYLLRRRLSFGQYGWSARDLLSGNVPSDYVIPGCLYL